MRGAAVVPRTFHVQSPSLQQRGDQIMTIGGSAQDLVLVGWRLILNSLGIRRARKIFAVGFAKAATTSLHSLFMSLGLPSYHGVRWRSCENLWLLRAFDCFSDGIPKDLAKLDRLFPGSKFILQVRDLESWVYSRLGHIERHKKKIPNYRVGPDWDTTEEAVKCWILNRNRHHLFVLEYFADRPDDLMVVNFIRDPSAGTRVANFLGYEGNFDRPVENVNPDKKTPASHVELLRKCAAEMNIPASELVYDVFCPSILESGCRPTFIADTSSILKAPTLT
jgi:hypothetical protein